ncbi:MAG TPA: TonB-dependent receptor [Bacteroidetes bacterium]|nr:TonB-dependent receptor [Bacteroidota bacterium]
MPTSKTQNMIRTGLLVLVSLLLAMPLSAQDKGTVSGKVTVAGTGEALPSASVSVKGTLRGASTNLDGEFKFTLAPGVYTLRASFIGYKSDEKEITVTAGTTVEVNFELEESALAFGDELVVVGSRQARTAIETPVPVDVISSTEVRESGHTETNQMLATVAPSFNASHQTIADGTDHINPASLRGLGPDQVLVLINGKRRHSSALVHVNGTFGRGTVGVDLNAIPTSAIERIEVLRDGAAAQYGSDAIAGVINIVLKEQTDYVEVNAMTGQTASGDGEQVKADINYGFKIGESGFFNVTGEFFDRGRTDRSDEWQGDIFPGISGKEATDAELRRIGKTRRDFSMKTGQGYATVGALFFNSVVPLSDTDEFYTFGGFSYRRGAATGFYRLPNSEARVVPEIYPFGFLPEIHTAIGDRAMTAGLRGTHNGWDVDLSITTGGNSFQFNIENTNNASMGPSSPTTFDAGRLVFNQTTGNLDLVRLLRTNAFKSVTFAMGGEFRVENYQIIAGEEASWQLGNGGDRPGIDFDTTSTGAPKAPGSQVFAGFQPDNEVNRYRNSISAYAGLETQVNDQLMVDLGARYENYSDFGSTLIGKIASRFEVTDGFALRGAVSTGFRAPSLHQVWFNNVSIQFVLDENNVLTPKRVLTANNKSSVTKAFGIPDLKEETSINYSAGFTMKPMDGLAITADFYRIDIADRIVLTSRFSDSDPIVKQILEPFKSQGVGQAQFFSNAVDTKTLGAEVVASYAKPLGNGTLTLTGSATLTKTTVDTTNIPEGVALRFANGDLNAVRNTIFNREERNRLETALPRQKASVGVRYAQDRMSLNIRATYYGQVEYRPTNPANDEVFSPKTIFDLDFGYDITDYVRLSIGGTNIFNTFPDKHQKASNYSNGRFPYSRRVTQFGMNGGFYYARLQFNL